MKISCARKSKPGGNIFLVALGLTAVISITLASYLTLVQGQADSVYRSQSYNSVMPVAEAGAEEALEFINSVNGWTNSLASNGWSSMSSSNTTTRSNFVSASQYYVVTISNALNGSPVIYSTGVVPFLQHAWSALMVNGSTSIGTSVVPLTRTIQIQTQPNGLFKYALAAKNGITFEAGANIDSFNSSLPTLSTNGLYTPTLQDDKAIVATVSQAVSETNPGKALSVRGYLNMGTNGTLTTPGSYSIGDNGWVNGGTVGVELSRSNDNFNVSFPDVAAPSATLVETATAGTVNGTNYDLVFYGNQYWGSSNVMYQQDMAFFWGQIALVTNGAVVLYVPDGDNLGLTGSSTIYISPGSQLTIYCGAQNAIFEGGNIAGATNASQFTFYGLPSCNLVRYWQTPGNAFTGVIYAPEADIRVRGTNDIVGSFVGQSLLFRNPMTLHYDENLVNTGPTTGYAPINWQEIPAAF